jgi:phage-related protein
LKNVVDAKIAEAKPIVQAALEKVKAAIEEMIVKAKAGAEAGIESGRGLLVELLGKFMAKLGELKDNLVGYNIFDDLLNDVLKPAIKHAIENLIPTIGKHLGDLADKLKPAEYLSISDIMEAAQQLKDIFNQIKAKIESGEVQDNVIDFLNKIKSVVEAKIAAATPAVKAILEKVDAAVKVVIEKAKAHVESGKGLLADLLETIIAKISELKDNIAGYNIFDDLLNDVLKPAIKHAIENLIPTIGKHLGDLADKLKPAEYLSISEVIEAASVLKDIFNQIQAKIESVEVQDNVLDFLNKIKALVEAKIAQATPAIKAILDKVNAAVKIIIEKAQAGVESGKGLLGDLLETIMAKISELKDNVIGYGIFDDLLNDVLKPALKHALENLKDTISNHLGNLADKLKPSF